MGTPSQNSLVAAKGGGGEPAPMSAVAQQAADTGLPQLPRDEKSLVPRSAFSVPGPLLWAVLHTAL